MADKIVDVTFNSPPKGHCFTGPGNIRVDMKDEDGVVHELFFYSDEISFSAEELIGKTVREVHALRLKKDIAYLQSP